MDSSRSSSSSLIDDTRRESQVPVVWCGGKNEGQNIRICLVQSSINDEVGGQNAILALVLVHSNRLLNCCKNFWSALAESFYANPSHYNTATKSFYPNPSHYCTATLHVNRDDVQPYIECFNVMYDPPGRRRSEIYYPSETGIEGLRYTLRLLGVSCSMNYLDLMLSVTWHLASIEWLASEENLLALKETPMRKENLRFLIERLCHSPYATASKLIVHLLKTARVEGWRPFEQEVVAMVHEALNSMLVKAQKQCDGKDSMEGMYAFLWYICQILNALMEAQVASQGVKCLLQYPSIPKFLSSLTGSTEQGVVAVVGVFKVTIMSIYNEVVGRNVVLGNSDRYTLLKDWTNFLEGYEKHEVRRGRLGPQYKRAKEAIFGSLSGKQKIELEHMTAEYGYYFIFGKPEKLLKALKNSMVARDE